jgi:hypothetical protein
MPSSSPAFAVLGPLDEADLMNSGLTGPITPSGTRRLHKQRLGPYSDKEYADVPLVSISVPDSHDAFSEIPANLVSEVTLRYLGCNKETAASIWSR